MFFMFFNFFLSARLHFTLLFVCGIEFSKPYYRDVFLFIKVQLERGLIYWLRNGIDFNNKQIEILAEILLLLHIE